MITWQKYELFSYRLYFPPHFFGNLKKHIVQFTGMDAFFILLILFIGILFGFLEGEQGHFILRFAYHRGVQLLVGEEVVHVDVANHRCFQEVLVGMRIVGIVANEHMSRCTY